MKPYLIIAGLLLVLLLAVLFWPTSENAETTRAVAITPTVKPAPIIDGNANIDDMVKPDVFKAPPRPTEVEISPNMAVDEFEAQEVLVDIPLNISDAAVKTSLMAVASSPTFAKLLVNERLIEKFVINVNNLANAELSPKDALVVPPAEKFKTYNQADRIWIDNASFQRYNSYVDALESVDADDLLAVFDNYEAGIKEKYAEISRPGQNFDSALIDAINTLLDTPQVPVPIEVYTDSVMFKFKDERLEKLSGPQKQLLRTGPENMRRIKDVLRSVKETLQERNE
ncbi:MAG: hypothetical protein ACJAVV_000905 [Alphaproteobacteria bacterium]|jgi:hypothetical protein